MNTLELAKKMANLDESYLIIFFDEYLKTVPDEKIKELEILLEKTND